MNEPAAAPLRVLTNRELNRATLARQMLLERVDLSPVEALERLVGLQAQTPRMWYVALWSRLRDFDPVEVSRLLTDRRLVRLVLMRAQSHVVSAADALALQPLLQTVATEAFMAEWASSLGGADVTAVAERLRELFAAELLTMPEVGARLKAEYKDADPAAIIQAARLLVPLVSVPPYGLWDASGPMAFTTVEAWLGRELGPMITAPELVKRYLAAFGPASAADIRVWSGLAGIGGIIDRLRPELETFQDVHGRELFDVPDAPRPDPSVPAPVRFLYDCDSLLGSYADVARFMAEEAEYLEFPNAVGQYFYGGVLVDGVAQASWRKAGTGAGTRLQVATFSELSEDQLAAVQTEGQALLRFLEPKAEGEVEIAPRY